MHILVAKLGDRWGSWHRAVSALPWTPISSDHRLQSLAESAIDCAFKTKPAMDFTFSDRQFDVVSADLAEVPEYLAAVMRNIAYTILCREGRLDTPLDRWAAIHRPANSTEMLTGLDFVFQPQTLKKKIAGWFDGEWYTFGAPRPHRQEATAPPYGRELLVRHGDEWLARQISPDSFPAFRPGPVVTPEMAAKRLSKLPMHKSAARRLKHAENLTRYRAEAAARQALRDEVAT